MAVSQASEWNGAVPAALSLLTGADVAMQHEIFDSFVEAAARQALRTGDQGLAEDSFLALEANRAASLRESRELAPLWKKWLPAAYWETLGRLNAAGIPRFKWWRNGESRGKTSPFGTYRNGIT